MSYQELVILLPCHSLEDFPQHHEGEEADGLLAGWTALWHPQLLAPLSQGPSWCRADDPPESLVGKLVVIPSVSVRELPAEFSDRLSAEEACVIQGERDRRAILDRALSAAGIRGDQELDLAADFLALGYCYLQMQLLTRQMRYSSNLDEGHFFRQLLAAAQAAVASDHETATGKLTACFDMLAEERDHYYSVDAYLLDLTLIEPGCSFERLQSELAAGGAINLLASATTLAGLPAELIAAVQQRLSVGSIGLVGGEQCEGATPLLSCETILAGFKQGAQTYQSLLGQQPEIFGRRRFGLSPLLPQLLDKLGYRGALHFTLDDGRFPLGTQAKTRWEGCDGSAVDAIAKVPLDATRPETFLGFAHRLGESMDMDHVSTLCLAHWSGSPSVWYDDLRRCGRFGNALGRFVTLDEYFRETYMPGHVDRFEADRYRSPYLQQAIGRGAPNALSEQIQYWTEQAEAVRQSGLAMLAAALEPAKSDTASDPDSQRPCSGETLDALTNTVVRHLPRCESSQDAYLVVNPAAGARRLLLDVSGLEKLPDVGHTILAAAESATTKTAVVDVPGMGFTWVESGNGTAPGQSTEPPLAEDLSGRDGVVVLRNEYLEAFINPETGALQSLKDYQRRTNRLSQQVAFRRAGPRSRGARLAASYSRMVADEIDLVRSDAVVGEVVARGRLVGDAGDVEGRFEQTFRVQRGSRLLELEVALEVGEEPAADPWQSYYASRFAWADETAQLYRDVHETRQSTDAKRFEAPHYVEIDLGETRTAILTGGLAYHRRAGFRMLDTLLIVRGEEQRRFRIGIGVDLPNPLAYAHQLLAPPISAVCVGAAPTSSPTGWLFHFDNKHVAVTSWNPLFEAGRLVGARLRVLETGGKAIRTKLSCFRPFHCCRRLDFRGRSLGDCRVEDGQIHLELASCEWCEFELRWYEPAEDKGK